MIGQTDLAGLTVESFLSGFNWSGVKIVPKPPVKTRNWLEMDLQEFLSHANWSGKAAAIASETPKTPSLNLTVEEYFALSSWSGSANPSPVLEPAKNKMPDIAAREPSAFSLEDLSNLF